MEGTAQFPTRASTKGTLDGNKMRTPGARTCPLPGARQPALPCRRPPQTRSFSPRVAVWGADLLGAVQKQHLLRGDPSPTSPQSWRLSR